MRFHMVSFPGIPSFLDLPWHQPLDQWRSARIVEMTRGIHRHVVRFVHYDNSLFALKELPDRVAEREFRLLRQMAEADIPVVEAIGTVTGRSAGRPEAGTEEELDGILITRHLSYSLPYRTLFISPGFNDLSAKLQDALAELLVRLHLGGFFWGDCSLSNTLFRRDAGALAAYLVDAETAEWHPNLSAGLRSFDLDIAEERIAGELMDLDAAGRLPAGIDPIATAQELRPRYEGLWTELTREECFAPNENYLIERRLQRLNELGFDVQEVEVLEEEDGRRLKLRTHLVEPGHHRRRLQILTGLDVQENQARRLLNDIKSYRARLEAREGTQIPESVAAYRWLNEVFEPTIAMVPPELRGKLEPAELYHQILEHRWFLSEAAGHDVGTEEAVHDYIERVLRQAPEERTVLATETTGQYRAVAREARTEVEVMRPLERDRNG